MFARFLLIPAFLLFNQAFLYGQQAPDSITQLPAKYLTTVSERAGQLEQQLDHSAEKAIKRMRKLEARMKRRLARVDSIKAIEIFGNAEQKYNNLQQQVKNKVPFKRYIPSLDTLSTSLKFIEQNKQLISQVKDGEKKLGEALAKVKGLENKFQSAEEIRNFLKERKQFLKDQLARLGFAKELKKLNKEVYYYSQQISEYKSLLKDHKKAERKALELLSKTKLFKDFMRKNSLLASLFRFPDDPNDPLTQANLAGLQTTAQINSVVQQQIAAGGPNGQSQFRQNLQEAQEKLNELKTKIIRGGGSNSSDEIAEGFKPNSQKTKSFFQRLEYGANIQTQKATNFFPVTSDIGLSLGYKLNDQSVIGIGGSYKMGWGRGWNNIHISHEGAGLRSFIDWKIKGSFWISGGYEQNYKSQLSGVLLASPSGGGREGGWQQSGLIGVSKVVSLKTKFFKRTKLQLLWDFLSYQQVPRTQAILFRIGYGIN